ncbi:MAG: RlmE family RNA methyltransferase [Phycisphaerales bacterium JB040]
MPRPRKLHDRYFNQAKREGYLARSAYKLIELDERFGVLKRGSRVLDLGCAPGSWLQVAFERVGGTGVVAGIDLQRVGAGVPREVTALQGDFTQVPLETLLGPTGGEAYDAVISDMAPNTTGHGDHFRSVRLNESILDRLPGLLRPGGTLVYKVLEGETFPELFARTKREFRVAKGCKPRASRDLSRETFVVATGYRPPRAPGDDDEGAGGVPAPKPGWDG